MVNEGFTKPLFTKVAVGCIVFLIGGTFDGHRRLRFRTYGKAAPELIERGMSMIDLAQTGQDRTYLNPRIASVSVVEAMGEWHVLVVENGVERSQSFIQRGWAESYASGQRRRLDSRHV